MMHNSNLMYVIYPCRLEEQDILETFFQNTMWKDHKLNKGRKGHLVFGGRKSEIQNLPQRRTTAKRRNDICPA